MTLIFILLLIVILGWQYSMLILFLLTDEFDNLNDFLYWCIPLVWIHRIVVKVRLLVPEIVEWRCPACGKSERFRESDVDAYKAKARHHAVSPQCEQWQQIELTYKKGENP